MFYDYKQKATTRENDRNHLTNIMNVDKKHKEKEQKHIQEQTNLTNFLPKWERQLIRDNQRITRNKLAVSKESIEKYKE